MINSKVYQHFQLTKLLFFVFSGLFLGFLLFLIYAKIFYGSRYSLVIIALVLLALSLIANNINTFFFLRYRLYIMILERIIKRNLYTIDEIFFHTSSILFIPNKKVLRKHLNFLIKHKYLTCYFLVGEDLIPQEGFNKITKCQTCGYEFDAARTNTCPKCGQRIEIIYD
jgi:hypothetical protein